MDELFEGAGRLSDARRGQMWQSVREAVDDGAWSRRRLPRRVGIAIAVVALGASTAAAVATFAQVTDDDVAECRSVAQDGTSISGTAFSQGAAVDADGSPTAELSVTVAEALSTCARFWRDGWLRRDHEGVIAPARQDGVHDGAPFPVPPLQVCVSGSGFAVVLVGDAPDVCTANGLDRLSAP